MPYITRKEQPARPALIGRSYLRGAGLRPLPARRWSPEPSAPTCWARPG